MSYYWKVKLDKAHLVISNFNTFPEELLSIGHNYTLYDQSDDQKVIQKLEGLIDDRVIFVGKSSGHNLINYLDFIIQNYESLPNVIAFVKGNMIGRHCTREWLMRSLEQMRYQFLYLDPDLKEKEGVQYQIYPSKFLEINNSWFAYSHPHAYFVNLNEFLDFLFSDYKPSKYVCFSPGACYIVERERILKHPKSFYQGLKILIGYEFRTAEAFFLERSLNIIFDADYSLRDYAFSLDSFENAISRLPDQRHRKKSKQRNRLTRAVAHKIVSIGRKFL